MRNDSQRPQQSGRMHPVLYSFRDSVGAAPIVWRMAQSKRRPAPNTEVTAVDRVSIISTYVGADFRGRAIAHWFLAALVIIVLAAVVAASVVAVHAFDSGWTP